MYRTKRFLSLFLAFVVVFTSFTIPVQPVFADNGRFTGNGFNVDFVISSSWATGYSAEIRITNTGNEAIRDWELTANTNLMITSTGISGGSIVSQENGRTVIANVGWNGTIQAGGIASIWIQGEHNGETPIPTQYVLNGDGFTSGNLGNDDDGDDPGDGDEDPNDDTNIPEPGDMPYLEVLTPFPDGYTANPAYEIEYITVPSEGARIEAVYYHINGFFRDYIYLAENNIIYEHPVGTGTLGEARVFIMSGPNYIEFFAVDSFDRVATFTVEAEPWHESGRMPGRAEIDPEYLITIVEDGQWYVSNRINIFLYTEVFRNLRIPPLLYPNEISIDVLADITAFVDGEIIAYQLGQYLIELPSAHTMEELLSIGESLENEFPHLIRSTSLSLYNQSVRPSYIQELYNSNTSALSEANNESGGNFQPFRNDSNSNTVNRRDEQWGLDAIRIPQAYEFIPKNRREEIRTIRVGIMDDEVDVSHPDLQIPIFNTNKEALRFTHNRHGTPVMGVLGAMHNNAGIDGAINISRNSLFAYDLESAILNPAIETDLTRELVNGLVWNVIRGVRVINVSYGHELDERYENFVYRSEYEEQMRFLLELGYDFIIVQGAGNEERNTSRGIGAFNDVRGTYEWNLNGETVRRNLRGRVIVVGAVEENSGNYRMWSEYDNTSGSNWGSEIDIVAPGSRILTTYYTRIRSGDEWIINDEIYMYTEGTSFAAPYVTGVAALVWSLNPAFSGDQVRDIILTSARSGASNIIYEHRANVLDSPTYPGMPAFHHTYYMLNADAAVRMALGEVLPEHTHGTLVGRVTSAEANGRTDNEIRSATVTLIGRHLRDSRQTTYRQIVRTDDDGYFTITQIPVNEDIFSYEYTVSADGYEATDVMYITIPAGVTTVLPRLYMVSSRPGNTAGGSAAGRVLAAKGEETAETLYNGQAVMEFIRGIYYIEPDMLEDEEFVEYLDFDIAETLDITDGNYSVSLPPGNYTVITSGEGIYTEISHIISYWEDGDEYWLNQNITVTPRVSALAIINYDLETYEPIEGAAFNIAFADSGRLVDGSPFVTNEDGMIVLNWDVFADYTGTDIIITQISVPQGYQIANPASLRVSLIDGETVSVFYENMTDTRIINHAFECPIFLDFILTQLRKQPGDPLYDYEAARVTGIIANDLGITSLAGIEYFTALQILYVNDNEITDADLSNNRNLREIVMKNNYLYELDLSNNINLRYLQVYENNLQSLDLSNNPALLTVIAFDNALTFIDVSNSANLQQLSVSKNNLQSIDISNNVALRIFDAFHNSLTSIDLRNNVNLETLMVHNNNLQSLDLSNNPALRSVYVYYNSLTAINLSNSVNLETLDVSVNNLQYLNLSNSPALRSVTAYNNMLYSINVSNCINLISLRVGSNNLSYIDISNNRQLETFDARSNNLSSINLSNNPALRSIDLYRNLLTEIDLSNNANLRYGSVDLRYNYIPSINNVWGWQSVGLVLESTLLYSPQRVAQEESFAQFSQFDINIDSLSEDSDLGFGSYGYDFPLESEYEYIHDESYDDVTLPGPNGLYFDDFGFTDFLMN